jgi:hypothetical protein
VIRIRDRAERAGKAPQHHRNVPRHLQCPFSSSDVAHMKLRFVSKRNSWLHPASFSLIAIASSMSVMSGTTRQEVRAEIERWVSLASGLLWVDSGHSPLSGRGAVSDPCCVEALRFAAGDLWGSICNCPATSNPLRQFEVRRSGAGTHRLSSGGYHSPAFSPLKEPNEQRRSSPRRPRNGRHRRSSAAISSSGYRARRGW